MTNVSCNDCFQPVTWAPIPERMEKLRRLIEKNGNGPADYAWKEYQHYKQAGKVRTAEFWWRCFVAWDG